MKDFPSIAILAGPTACGKTALSLEIAQKFPDIEILNADSLLFYQGLNIGTAKPSPIELNQTPHHLINLVEPNTTLTAADFVKLAHECIHSLHQNGKRVVVVGGSGFYLKALIYGVWNAPPTDPNFRASLSNLSNEELWIRLQSQDQTSRFKVHLNDRYRLIRALEILNTNPDHANLTPTKPPFHFHLFALDRENEDLYLRISKRTELMIEQGLLEECSSLLQKYGPVSALRSVGYDQCIQYLQQIKPQGREIRAGLDGLKDEINLATRQLVKSQRTFLKSQFKDFEYTFHYSLPEAHLQVLQHLSKIYSSPTALLSSPSTPQTKETTHES